MKRIAASCILSLTLLLPTNSLSATHKFCREGVVTSMNVDDDTQPAFRLTTQDGRSWSYYLDANDKQDNIYNFQLLTLSFTGGYKARVYSSHCRDGISPANEIEVLSN